MKEQIVDDLSKEYHYIVSFMRKKIKEGAKQTDIAQGIGKSISFINRLYLDKNIKKRIDPAQQKKIARYFGISKKEMLEEGRKWLQQLQQNEEKNSEKKEIEKIKKNLRTMANYDCDLTQQLINMSVALGQGIAQMQAETEAKFNQKIAKIKEEAEKDKKEALQKLKEKIKALKKSIEIDRAFFDATDEDIIFFNVRREYVFGTKDNWFTENVALGQCPTIDRILLFHRQDIRNFDEIEKKIQEAFKTQKKMEVVLKYGEQVKKAAEFRIKIIPIFNDGTFEGIFMVITFSRMVM